jgi:hypothetical protein
MEERNARAKAEADSLREWKKEKQEQRPKQIPCGNDSKRSKNNGKGKSKNNGKSKSKNNGKSKS